MLLALAYGRSCRAEAEIRGVTRQAPSTILTVGANQETLLQPLAAY